jgi:hypothetical protein
MMALSVSLFDKRDAEEITLLLILLRVRVHKKPFTVRWNVSSCVTTGDHGSQLSTRRMNVSFIIQGVPDSIRQFSIINNQSIQQHTGKWESTFCCPIFPCVVGLIGY